MSELNGTNLNFNSISKNIQPKSYEVEKIVVDVKSDEVPSDITTNHAEIIGRSMLSNDSTKNDLDALIKNPTIAENSDKLFEFVYLQAEESGLKNPYEEAANFATTQL